MKVEVLRVLIIAQVRQNAGRPMLGFHIPRHEPHDVEQLPQKVPGRTPEVGERGDVLLGYHHDVHRPVGPGVVVGEHPFGLADNVHLGLPGEHFVAIEVVGHP